MKKILVAIFSCAIAISMASCGVEAKSKDVEVRSIVKETNYEVRETTNGDGEVVRLEEIVKKDDGKKEVTVIWEDEDFFRTEK